MSEGGEVPQSVQTSETPTEYQHPNEYQKKLYAAYNNIWELTNPGVGEVQKPEDIARSTQLILDNEAILKQAIKDPEEVGAVISSLGDLASPTLPPEVQRMALRIAQNNIGAIDSRITPGDPEESFYSLEPIARFINATEPEVRDFGLKFMSRHYDDIFAGLKYSTEMRGIPSQYLNLVVSLIKFGESSVPERARRELEDFLNSPETPVWKTVNFITDLMDGGVHEDAKGLEPLGYLMLRNILERYNLNLLDSVTAWNKSFPAERALRSGVLYNLTAILELESQVPGICSYLNKECGIYDFARYPKEMLMKQYEQRDNTNLPYGVVFFPKNDHNGAFYTDTALLAKLTDQLSGLGYGIRVFEGESKWDIGRTLIRLDHKYGKKQKIAFAVIGGHGSGVGIHFGGEDSRHFLAVEDFWSNEGKPVETKASRYFEDQPTLILASCSTGREEGIASDISRAMHAEVIAPGSDAALKSIDVTHIIGEDGKKKLAFTVDFGPANPVTYSMGKTLK